MQHARIEEGLADVVVPYLHADQLRALEVINANRFAAIRAGRRWGKTDLAKIIVCDTLMRVPFSIGWFAPDYMKLREVLADIIRILQPVTVSSSKTEKIIKCLVGGFVEFWTLQDNPNAGRSRGYHLVVIDDGAFTNNEWMLSECWKKSIKPTLYDYGGKAIVCSNTYGVDPDNFFWQICNNPEHGFAEFHARTHDNPCLPARLPDESYIAWQARRVEELAALERDNPPLVYRQEHLAEFVDWSGVAFFDLQKLLVDGKPIPQPKRVDAVFATIDTAVKTGKEHDGTAVVYWGLNRLGDNFPLCLLDYDLIQIEGSLLDTWLQTVFQRGEELARATLSRAGWVGAWIEDKSTGMVLIQQAQRRGWNAHAIESKLTSVGKAERAINISDYVHTEKVKITEHAHNKTVVYKDASRNHLIEQILAFRVGDKDTKRADDLLDTFTYGIEIGLGDQGWV